MVYSFHFYEPHEYTHQGIGSYPTPVPLPADDNLNVIHDAKDFVRNNNVAMFVGEIGIVRWAPGAIEWQRRALKLFADEKIGFTYHCWRCWQGMDPEINPAADMWIGPWDRLQNTEAMKLLRFNFSK
jgi:hypothetical protein